MTEKIDPYDVLTKLVLGTLMICAVGVAFPAIASAFKIDQPSAFKTIALIAMALFAGELLQALSSALEPGLYLTFGGRPSDNALDGQIPKLLPKAPATRVRDKLRRIVGASTSSKELFYYARAMVATSGRVPKFNAQYGYHRGMVVMVLLFALLFAASSFWGAAKGLSWKEDSTLAGVIVLVLWLVWYRTKQWSYYYVREVIVSAEQEIDKRATTPDLGNEASERAERAEESDDAGDDDDGAPDSDDNDSEE